MSDRRRAIHSILALTLGLLSGLAACASEPAPARVPAPTKQVKSRAEISNELTATAQVVGLDKPARLVTLRGEDGRLVDVLAGDAVRNLDQVAVGDTLRVKYKQVLAATLLPPGSDPTVVQGGLAAGRAELGAKPAGAVGAQVSLRVKIVSTDATQEVVVFSLPSGELIAHRIATPEGREFVKGLKVGDLVQLDYSEALALSIETLKSAG